MTREEAIKILDNLNLTKRYDSNDAYYIGQALTMAIEALEQEPKTGYREYNDIYDHYLCGNCKTVVMDYDNYCPNCGCRMVEKQERSE